MFTGIVSAQAKVTKANEKEGGLMLSVVKPESYEAKIGDSISVNGVCSTIVSIADEITFEYMPESLERSNLRELSVGNSVNLEQSLKASDRLDGHIVQGHVDTTAAISSVEDEGNSKVFTLYIEDTELIAPKGAITVDGISLTVVDVEENNFSIKIIPHTLKNTNLGTRAVEEKVNIEFDILAKYLKQMKSHADGKT